LDAAGTGVLRLDTTDLGPGAMPVTAHVYRGAVTGQLAGIDLDRVSCVWHRRPSEVAAATAADVAEVRAGIGGLFAGLPYLNHPADMALAGFKPYQLVLAARCGLPVPETVITTDRATAAGLAHRLHGAVVVKPMSTSVVQLVTEHDRGGWRRPVHLTQQRVDTGRFIRLTVVDQIMLAVEIRSPRLDWRAQHERCTYRVVHPPGGVIDGVRRLLAALRLRFAALDFAVDPADGTWWFLEINPNGQWLWLEHATGLPIAATLAASLARPNTNHSKIKALDAASRLAPAGQ
jgi:hypothetical protein